MNPKLISLISLCSLLFLGTGYYLGQSKPVARAPLSTSAPSAAKTAADTLKRENTKLQEDVTRLTTEVAQLNEAAKEAAARSSTTSTSSIPSTPAPAPTPAEARERAIADGHAFLAANAQARDMLFEIGKAQAGRNFAHFYRMVSLPPAQIEELERQTAAFMLQNVSMTPTSLTPTTAELPEVQAKSILGEEGYQQYLDYRRMMPLAGFVNDVSSLSPNEPLTPQQSTQLLTIIANANTAFRNGGRADNETTDWNQVFTQAQPILTPAQMAALKADTQLPRLRPLIRQFYQQK